MYKRIRELRKECQMTQEEVAKTIGCSQRVYSNYEHGERDIPTKILISLAKLYNTTADYVLELDNERTRKS